MVEAFAGDFVLKPQPHVLQDAAASRGYGCSGEGDGAKNSVKVAPKVSKWVAIGRAGKLSARAAAVCAQEVMMKKVQLCQQDSEVGGSQQDFHISEKVRCGPFRIGFPRGD